MVSRNEHRTQGDRISSDSRLGFRAFALGTDGLTAMPEASLLDSFAEIEDPRHPRNTLCPTQGDSAPCDLQGHQWRR